MLGCVVMLWPNLDHLDIQICLPFASSPEIQPLRLSSSDVESLRGWMTEEDTIEEGEVAANLVSILEWPMVVSLCTVARQASADKLALQPFNLMSLLGMGMKRGTLPVFLLPSECTTSLALLPHPWTCSMHVCMQMHGKPSVHLEAKKKFWYQ